MSDFWRSPFVRRLLAVAVVLHLAAAWFSTGHYKDDEYYDVLEIVDVRGSLALPDGGAVRSLPSYDEKLRSGFQPFLVWIASQAMSGAGLDSPFLWAFALRLLSVLLALVASLVFFAACRNNLQSESAQKWVLAAMLLLWTLIFYHARFSSEGWAVSWMLLGMGLLRGRAPLVCVAAGFCLGMAFVCRYAMGLMLLPLAFFVVLVMRLGAAAILRMAAGAAAAFFIDFASSWWLYESPILPWLHFLAFHLNGFSAASDPWHLYFLKGGEFMPPIGYLAPALVAAFWIAFPRHILTWATILYVPFHLWIENRQIRFMLPVLVFLPLMTAMIWERSIRARPFLHKSFLWILGLSAAVNAPLALFAAFAPAAAEVNVLRDCVIPQTQAGKTPVFVLDEPARAVREKMILHFYTRGKVDFVPVADEEEMARRLSQTPALFVSRRKRDEELRRSGVTYKFLCAALPDSLLRLNVNNWADRASIYPVYEVTRVAHSL